MASELSSVPPRSDNAYVKTDMDIPEQPYIHKFNNKRVKYKSITISQKKHNIISELTWKKNFSWGGVHDIVRCQ